MSALIQISIDLSKIDKTKIKDGKYLNVTINVNDDTKYDNNVSMCINQSKIEQEAKEKKVFIGNGRVVWTDGKIVVAEKAIQKTVPIEQVATQDDGLPF